MLSSAERVFQYAHFISSITEARFQTAPFEIKKKTKRFQWQVFVSDNSLQGFIELTQVILS